MMKTFRNILVFISCFYFPVFADTNPTTAPTCFKIISRGKWGARPPLETEHLDIPIENVIVHHTVSEKCETENTCIGVVKSIQEYHMGKNDFPDIGYNFLVGGDGKIYEGTGWHHKGTHTKGYNTKSLGVALIGNFSKELPSQRQLLAFDNFLECAVNMLELSDSYKLLGARQVRNTDSPGDKLYEELQKFGHYSTNLPNKTVVDEDDHQHHH